MSRGRRRDRRMRLGHHWPGATLPPLSELKPLFDAPAEPWSDPAIAPVLPLEGMSEWETIRLPALALEEPPEEPDLVATSRDPFQLVLEDVVAVDDADGYDAMEQADGADDYAGSGEPVDGSEAQAPAVAALDAPGEAEPMAHDVATEMLDDEADQETDAEVAGPYELTAEQMEAEADLAAVAELEVLAEAARADTHLADVAADMIARAIEDSSPDERPTEEESPAAEFPSATAAEAVPAPAPEAAPEPEPEPEPDPVELQFAEAQAAALGGRADDARALYRQVLAQRPLHVRARNNLALLLDAAGDHTGALAELDRALDVDQDNSTLLVNRGALLGQMGRFQAAERDLKKVLREEPNNAEALFNLGVVMSKKGLWAEAVPSLRRAIELQGDRAAAHFYLGEAQNHVDDLQGAMLSYQRAAELMPNHSRALYGLGIVYDRMGRPDDAAQMYRRSREVAQQQRR